MGLNNMFEDAKLFEVDIDPNDAEALVELARIRPDQLEQEMRVHPAVFAFWNAQLVNAYEHVLLAKHNLDTLEAKTELRLRKELEDLGKKVTEKAVAARLQEEDEIADKQLEVIRAEAAKRRIDNVVTTIKIKGDMLTNIGMRINAEIRSNPITAAQARGDRVAGL